MRASAAGVPILLLTREIGRQIDDWMSGVTLSEKFLATIAGWEAMKQARAYLEMGRVLSSNWTAPILKGVVQDGSITYRAGLVIRSATDVENICTCRPAREWGTMCAHAVAVGLHHLRGTPEASVAPMGGK